jgi:hypothetical protein
MAKERDSCNSKRIRLKLEWERGFEPQTLALARLMKALKIYGLEYFNRQHLARVIKEL